MSRAAVRWAVLFGPAIVRAIADIHGGEARCFDSPLGQPAEIGFQPPEPGAWPSAGSLPPCASPLISP